jgi:hypothetical protein
MAIKKQSFIIKLFFGIIKAIFIIVPLLFVALLYLGGFYVFYGNVFIVVAGTGLAVYYIIFGAINRKISAMAIPSDSTGGFSFVSESGMASVIGNRVNDFNSQEFPAVFPTEVVNVKTYRDAEEKLSDYKTFDFDYINKTNPLLEKELFGQLEKVLQEHGMTRTKKNPQVTVSMDFFIGKKEQYTPPTTVTSTELRTVWNYGMIGWTPGGFASQVPVTSSQTTPGYTTTSYYNNIRLNFLNHSKLAKGAKMEIPPLIWIGEADSEGADPDIRGIAPLMFGELAGEFPKQSSKSPKRYVCRLRYSGLGLGFSTSDWRVVRYVEPGSVAAEHGIKPGDAIVKVNGNRTVINWAARGAQYLKNVAIYRPKDPYYQYVLSSRGDEDVELVIKSAETRKMVTLKVKPRFEGVGRYVYINPNPLRQIVRANPIGIAFVIIVTAIVVYYLFLK